MEQHQLLVLVLGYVSGVLTTLAGVPQVVKVFRNSSTQDLSYMYMSMTIIGRCTWTIYGYFRDDTPMVVWNLTAIVIYGAMMSLKVYIECFKTKKDVENTNKEELIQSEPVVVVYALAPLSEL
jgi:MtN3 and saliva related transmembrane protein